MLQCCELSMLQILQCSQNVANVTMPSKCYKYCGGLKMLIECCRGFGGKKLQMLQKKMFPNAAEPADVAVLSML